MAKGRGRSAATGLMAGLVVLVFQAACHKKNNGPDNGVQPPVVSYRTPVILATAGQPYTSVAPDASAYVHINGVPTIVTTGITFTVVPELPAGLSLDSATGLIAGTPANTFAAAAYTVFARNSGGTGLCQVSLGVQASSPVTLAYGGQPNAAAGAVGASLALAPPTVTGGTATGFGVRPALPAGLALNPATGLVSGTPAAALPGTPFTLTATTAAGSANATFTLLVAAAAPDAGPSGLTCPDLAATSGQAFIGPIPALAVGADVVYTLSPALPAGLVLDPLTGQVTGTPVAPSAAAPFVLTASNAVGSTPVTFQVTVN